ncbi:hypothetical protein PFISCL1PPCAC_4664, partial [Pristionchus fissidentatus]
LLIPLTTAGMPLKSDRREGFRKRELSRLEVVNSVTLRLKHVVDECPKRNVIFEVDADYSEDAFVLVVDKLRTAFGRVDVIVHDAEYLFLIVNRLKEALKGSTVAFANGVAKFRGCSLHGDPGYLVTVASLHHFMVANFDDRIRGRSRQNRAAVLYRTEELIESKSLLQSYPVESIDAQVTPLLRHVYRTVDVLRATEVVPKLREFIKRHTDRFVYRFLEANIEKLVESAREAKDLVQGAHFGFIQANGENRVILSPAKEREHLGLLQFVQIHHSLTVTPLKIEVVKQSPLHLLKGYDRIMGVVRRSGYELRQWLPFMTQLTVYPSRVYPHETPIVPLLAQPPAATISEWIVGVEMLMIDKRKIPRSGARLVVCPSSAAMNQLWRYLKYSHDETLALIPIVICTTMDELERAVVGKPVGSLITILTTAVHFTTWHTRYMGTMHDVMVFLGTPTKDKSDYIHRAFRFARNIFKLITVPLERSGRNANDSGIDSCSEDELRVQMNSLMQVEDRGHWARVFMEEMWGRGVDWRAPITNADDGKYDKCVEWASEKWKNEEKKANYEEWKRKMMEKYRSEMEI